MKKTIALSLVAALVIAPLRIDAVPTVPTDPKNSFAMGICLMGIAAVVGGGVVFIIKTCRPKYYCVQDEDGNRFASNATRSERAANDWKVKSGPYNSIQEAYQYCPPTTNTASLGPVVAESQSGEDEVYIPAIPIKIWKSTNLVDWVLRDTILDDPSHFSWSETNSGPAAFYKASY